MRLHWFHSPPGPLQRVLPTFGASPLRRTIQALALLLFCILFFWICWPYGDADYAAGMQQRERIPAETFLLLDPLLSLSTALASRTWIFALAWGGSILGICLLIPRGFCGYLCPLGTIIDLADWSVGRHITRFRLAPARAGWWTALKYYLLAATLLASTMGVLLSGFVAAIPVLTRGLQFTLAPLQLGVSRGFYLVPPMNAGQWFSIALFLLILALGLLRQRFWCRYLCPTGALFSIANRLRVTERKVNSACIACGKCVRICPFDAINADFSTRTSECTFCQTCGGVCPTAAIEFTWRSGLRGDGPSHPEVCPPSRAFDIHTSSAPSAQRPGTAAAPQRGTAAPQEICLSRRGLLAAGASGAVLALGVDRLLPPRSTPLVRPPGSVPEEQFLQLCIRCGECFKACPNNVLQPVGFGHGPGALWTPQVVANWSGCEPSCNNCGQVCPTGAIRPLPIAEKRAARIGLAVIDPQTCLPYAGESTCRMCADECAAAGYRAIEFRTAGVTLDEEGMPVEGSGRLVPVVLSEACIGCGLCQTRCQAINVKQNGLLRRSAIFVVAGAGNEDRLRSGSYLQLQTQRRTPPVPQSSPATSPAAPGESYLPDFLQ